jgi:hypothetical protein
MAIKDLQQSFTLLDEWNDFVNSTVQISSWCSMSLGKISALTSDPNYALNASSDEMNFVNSFQTVIQTFQAQLPSNPDKIV